MSNNGRAPTYGDLVEAWVTSQMEYEFHDESWYDHRTEEGVPIQVKGTQPWISNGYTDGTQTRTRGRFRLWERDHTCLLEENGLYLLVLYEVGDNGISVESFAHKTPEMVGAHAHWFSVASPACETKGRTARINWTYLMEESE